MLVQYIYIYVRDRYFSRQRWKAIALLRVGKIINGRGMVADLWQARVNIEVSHSTSRYKSEKKEKRMEKAESKELLL